MEDQQVECWTVRFIDQALSDNRVFQIQWRDGNEHV